MRVVLKIATAVVLAACQCGEISTLRAETYPARPIKIIHPYTAGSASDTALRLISQRVSGIVGQNIVVENKPGAGGTLGIGAVKSAAADGYTLGQLDINHVLNMTLMPNLPYDPVKDLQPIARLYTAYQVLLVPAGSPATSVAELAALAKQKSGGLSFASQGVGSAGHLLGARAAKLFGAPMVHVPYSGAGAVAADLASGRVDLTFAIYGAYRAQIEAGQLRALAIAAPERIATLPNIPTMRESGFPALEISVWFGLAGPAGVEPAIVDKLNAAFAEALRDAEIAQKLEQLGFALRPSSPQDFREQIKRDAPAMAELVRDAGLTAQ